VRLLALALGLVLLAEAGLRLHDWLRLGLPFLWDPVHGVVEPTRPMNPFLLTRGVQENWSTRGKPPGLQVDARGRRVLRVVCIGGEATFDRRTFEQEGTTYPAELQRLLNQELDDHNVVWEVLNAAIPSYTSLHGIILLQTELLQLQPDVVVWCEALNDVTVNYFAGPTAPAYAGYGLHASHLPPELGRSRTTTLLDHSRLYSLARELLRPVVWYRIKYLPADAAVTLPHSNQFRSNLRNLVAICKAHGIQVVLGQQPYAPKRELFEQHFKSKACTAEVVYPVPSTVHDHLREYNRLLREVAVEEHVPCADLYSACVGQEDLFIDCVRLRAAGCRRVAQVLLRTLRGQQVPEESLAGRRKLSVSY
jgi:lysophospholipase L1-like esterase